MGFKSPKAIQNCHKSWQLLVIILKGNAKELVVSYVRHCLPKRQIPNVESFFKFIQTCGPNFVFMYKCTFTFLLALKLFRSGVRNCDHEANQCAINELSSLFNGLNMTTYMEIDLRRRFVESKCPDILKSLYENLTCMSRSGHNGKAEGCDFILEAFNRKVKKFMPPGPATTKRWLRAYRNLPLLEKIKQSLGLDFFNDTSESEGFR
ncbi:uncharacterized protein LOC132718959 [Ruditapes philippinarum]|uniref:uncharacterized protein LOC132718959 n=1 Tax=Ruditapes philippinarum TaxID=129788 RepID=UPI00295C09F6|nr:uncharacterized protein LOC132718959 [Ruditapes philippinarum]